MRLSVLLRWRWSLLTCFFFFFFFLLHHVACQTPNSTDSCEGVVVTYRVDHVELTYPHRPNGSSDQPFTLDATLTLRNQGFNEVRNWQAFVGFLNPTLLVSAKGAVLADGTPLPANVGNGTSFQGLPGGTDLLTAAETAGDITKFQIQIPITGTVFGAPLPQNSVPSNISLENPGWTCGKPSSNLSSIFVCCAENRSADIFNVPDKYNPRLTGDINIIYDVLTTDTGSYTAQVTISNDNPLGRIDNWQLNFTWTQGEYIPWMKGATATEQDEVACLEGQPGVENPGANFNGVVTCKPNPTIVDLAADKANDSQVGLIPFCCRNGTLLPKVMDASRSKSVFLMGVNKLKINEDRTALVPPISWSIGERYECSNAILVDPSEFPDPTSMLRTTSAVRTWQVTCNLTVPSVVKPKCCVSFSAFYNDSAIPCNTCACGCPQRPDPIYFNSPYAPQTCDANGQALLLPTYELLVPFANRSRVAQAWAIQRKLRQPLVPPCGDNCPVNINWHVYSDYTTGWSAKITLFNWGNNSHADWFTAVQLNRSVAGFQAAYSINGTRLLGDYNNTIFLQGLPGLNYLIGAQETRQGFDSGKIQSIMSFTKKNLDVSPKLDIVAGDGFPNQVIFNGEVCSLPNYIPSSARQSAPTTWLAAAFAATLLSVFLLSPGGLW